LKVQFKSIIQTSRLAFCLTGAICCLIFSNLGCESLRGATKQRELVIDNTWTRSTTKGDFLGFRRMNRMPPLVLENMVIQANAIDGMTAYDRKSGSVLWRLDVKNGVEGGAQADRDKLYFGASDGSFYCVSLLTGKTLWTAPARAETLAQPTVEKGIVYFETGADMVYALDGETGKQLWQYNRQVSASLSIRATTRPVIEGETLLVGFSDGYVVALRKHDGGLIWERKLGRGARFKDVDSTPVVDEKNVYVSSFDAALYSLKLETGEVNWTLEEGGFVPVTLGRDQFNDRLFYSTANGKVLALEKRSGKVLLTIPVKHGIATQPAFLKNLLLFGESEGNLILADAGSGATLGHFSPGEGIMATPTVVESSGEAYFMSNGANLFAMHIGYRRTLEAPIWHAFQ
jgi:outer membrane protein assembly factor BamB